MHNRFIWNGVEGLVLKPTEVYRPKLIDPLGVVRIGLNISWFVRGQCHAPMENHDLDAWGAREKILGGDCSLLREPQKGRAPRSASLRTFCSKHEAFTPRPFASV